VIANWPTRRINHWVTLLQARAIENQAFVIGVNRCGSDPFLEYAGRSLVIHPSGEILIEAGDLECVVSCEIDSRTVSEYRSRLPFLRDMRAIDIGGGAGLKAGRVSSSTGEA
jgi:predicted amidohydrolase